MMALSVWQQMESQVEDSIVDKAVLPVLPTPMGGGMNEALNLTDVGIMPDQPWYPIQVVKDRWRIFWIKEPVERARLYRELADRRLQTAGYLLDRGKPDQAAETLIKAEGYLVKAQEMLDKCEQTEAVVNEWLALYETAQVHKGELQRFRQTMPIQVMSTVDKAWERLLLVEAQAKAGCD